MGIEAVDSGVEDARRSGDLTALGVALIGSSGSQSTTHGTRERLAEALSCLRRSGDEYWEPTALNNLAWVDLLDGDRDSARRFIDEGIALSRVSGTNNVLTTLLSNLGEVELAEGNISAAREAFTEAIRMQIRTGLVDHVSDNLVGGIAMCASAQEDSEAAAFLYGAADAASGHAGIDNSEYWAAQHQEQLRNKTNGSGLDAAFAEGHSLSPREALNAAFAWSDERSLPGRGGGQTWRGQ
jgi:hypothetical protein